MSRFGMRAMYEKPRVICLLVILLVIAAAFSIPAYADAITNYTLSFTTSIGSPTPVSGSFTYDSTHPLFTNFVVMWNGKAYNLTAEANSPTIAGSGCAGEASTPAYGFGIMSESLVCGGLTSYVWSGFAGQGTGGAGIFDFIVGTRVGDDFISAGGIGTGTPTAVGHYTIQAKGIVPEPSTLLLLGTGLLSVLGAARRKLRL